MKYLLLVITAFLILSSCEDVETNSPAFQGELNNVLFKANDARAAIQEDSTLIIQGIDEKNTVTLKLRELETGTYIIGTARRNYATFEKGNTFYYSTNPNGEGEVIVTEIDEVGETITGTFRFSAIASGFDTLYFQKGIFYQIPYNGGSIENPEIKNAGNLSAKLNGNIFNSFSVNARETGNSITIVGLNATKSITLKLPQNVEAGSYNLLDIGYKASFKVDTQTENAVSGSIVIISNDITQRKIKATFSFETASNSIREGNFIVIY